MDVLNSAKEVEHLAIEFRQHLHRHPELSGKEYGTLAYISEHLDRFGIDYVEVEDGGILGFIGDAAKGRTLLLRADIDALPILENDNNLTRKRTVISANRGVHHACGHDAHTAMLLATGKVLKEHEGELPGRVVLFFERGEEGGGNIRYLLDYIDAHAIRIDAAHGIHVSAENDSGELVARAGAYSAGATGFNVVLSGSDGHGSRPDLANHPLDCFVAIYNALNTIRLKYISPFDQLTFIVGQVHNGTAGNIIAKDLLFSVAARFFHERVGERFVEEAKAIIKHTAAAYHCTYELSDVFFGLPVINDSTLFTIARDVISQLGAGALVVAQEPGMGSESFSHLSARYPSIMLRLGIANPEVGSGAGHHTEFFDVDEGTLYVGVAETLAFTKKVLEYEGELLKPS